MRQSLTALVSLLAVSGLSLTLTDARAQGNTGAQVGVAQPAPRKAPSQATIAEFTRIRTPGGVQFGPAGEMYVRDWPDGIFQLYAVQGDPWKQTAGPGSSMTRLTSFPDGLGAASVSPSGLRIALSAASGGNENSQISILAPQEQDESKRIIPILTNPRVQYNFSRWTQGGMSFLYSANDERPSDFSVYLYRFPGLEHTAGSSVRLLSRPGSWAGEDMTDDGERVLVGEFRSVSDARLYELTVATGELRPVGRQPAEGSTAAVNAVGYFHDQDRFLYVSDIEEGIPRLFWHDLGSGLSNPVDPKLNAYEVDQAVMSDDRRVLAVVTNEDGYGVLHLYRLPSMEPITLPEIPRGVIGLADVSNSHVAFTLSNAQTPGLTFVMPVPPPGAALTPPRQVTFADDRGIDLASFTLPQLVRYTSFDGLEIPAFVYTPAGFKPGAPIPFVVNYHGGPESQFRPGFDRTIQYLVSRGFGVMQPNVRGSTGYGRAFHQKDNYRLRWDSVKDGVAAARWLVDNGYAIPGRMSTWGGSYGGFMSVACLIEDSRQARQNNTTRLFGAGINVVGIVNFETFLKQTADYRRALREAEYGPLSDPEFLRSVSPINFMDDINVPMMISHGLNDPRVPVGEAMQLAEELQRRGFDPELLFFHDEGHGLAKLDNRLLFAERMVKFLKRTIGPEAPAASGR